VIGYKSVTFTESKRKKVFVSGVFNIVYGLIMVALTPIANFGLAGKIVLLVLMPVMHEGMLTLQGVRESKKHAKFVSDDEGVTVLDVSPNSEAFRLGLKTGDKILELNDDKLTEYTMIYEAISDGLKELKLKIKDRQGYIKEVMISIPDGGAKKLGMVLIPKGSPKDGSMVRFGNNNFKDVLDNIRKKK
ncbi:PDZ domain-containing protein, partial [Clostridium frigidicarnis]